MSLRARILGLLSRRLRTARRDAAALARLLSGLVSFARTRTTPHSCYVSMRFLYYRTGGLSHRAIAGVQNTISRLRNPIPSRPLLSETAFNLNAEALDGVVNDLKKRGYYFFPGA